MKRLAIIILMFFIGMGSFAQQGEVYRSMKGKFGLSIYWGDTLVNAGSNDMFMELRHDTRELILRLDPSTMRSNSDSLNKLIEQNMFREVQFRGIVEKPYINLESQSNDRFQVTGDLTINGVTRRVTINVNLLHWTQQAMGITHMMTIHYHVQLDDFGLREDYPNLGDFACVEILQPVLRPVGR